MRHEKEDKRWIRITGGPLDLRMGLCIGTSRKDCEKSRNIGVRIQVSHRSAEKPRFVWTRGRS
jgi:hypothetical protein